VRTLGRQIIAGHAHQQGDHAKAEALKSTPDQEHPEW
jgi:hypothetical protein